MVLAFRLSKKKHAQSAFSGLGAQFTSGRWNHQGIPIVYTSDTPSLAILEILVHTQAQKIRKDSLVLFTIEIPKRLIENYPIKKLPKDWDASLSPNSTQQIGKIWYQSQRSAVLQVPSIIVPKQFNYLLNPNHPDFKEIHIHDPEEYKLDIRL